MIFQHYKEVLIEYSIEGGVVYISALLNSSASNGTDQFWDQISAYFDPNPTRYVDQLVEAYNDIGLPVTVQNMDDLA